MDLVSEVRPGLVSRHDRMFCRHARVYPQSICVSSHYPKQHSFFAEPSLLRHLEPGGYLEMQDLTNPLACDDGTLHEGLELYRLGHLLVEASDKAGRPNNTAPRYKEYLEKAGFVDVVEKKHKWPLNRWPKDKKYKEIGAWTCENLTSGLEGLLLALLTRFLDWEPEEVLAFCTLVRKQLRDTSIHAYIPV